MNLPINHLIKTLDRCCGQWEILNHDEARQKSDSRCWGVVVKHLNTGEIYRCNFRPSTGKWESDDDSFLVNRLNGLTRDDDGDPLPVVLGKSVDELCKEAFDFDCVPEPSEAPFKAGDWVVCVDDSASSGITVGSVYLVLGLDESGDPELTCDDGYRSYYLALRFRRARPDEIPQTVNQIPCGGCGAKTSKERCIGCFHNFGDEPQPATPRTPADAPPTLQQSNAEICRQNGWTVGTVLEGDEGLGPEQIEITAIGKDCVLACRETDEYESLWSLKYRQWKVVSPPALQLREGAWYERRDGKIVGPAMVFANEKYPWIAAANTYTDSGRFWGDYGESRLDLIREVPPPQTELKFSVEDFGDVVKAKLAESEPQPDSEGWIEWSGGECPVDAGSKIEVRLRDCEGEVRLRDCDGAVRLSSPESYRWQHGGSISDIVAYRIVQPATEPLDAPQPEPSIFTPCWTEQYVTHWPAGRLSEHQFVNEQRNDKLYSRSLPETGKHTITFHRQEYDLSDESQRQWLTNVVADVIRALAGVEVVTR